MTLSRLQTPLTELPGIGAWRAERLAHLDLHTVEDVLLHFPHRWEDRRDVTPIRQLADALGRSTTVYGRVREVSCRTLRPGKGPRNVLEIDLCDETGTVAAVWFNRTYLADLMQPGAVLALTGKPQRYRGFIQFSNPEFELIAGAEDPGEHDADDGDDALRQQLSVGRVVPFYHLTATVSMRYLRRLAWRISREYAADVPDVLPEALRRAHGLLTIDAAVRAVHYPESPEELEAARRRMVYEELFVLSVGMALRKRNARLRARGRIIKVSPKVDERIRARLPFKLTDAQERSVAEITADLAAGCPMNRLLQGDVGSGKTAVAIYACLATIAAKAQAAVMVPTEILAQQHYGTLKRLLAGSRVRLGLLTAGAPQAKRRALLARLQTGEVDLVVGTHALQEDAAAFRDLALVVMDEQHKFGVLQRTRLRSKGVEPHVLVMTATPIPRTLALGLYGDLDLSVLDERPPGRKGVRTRNVAAHKRADAYAYVRREVERGRQAYVICPLVEENADSDLKAAQQTAEELRRGPLHGMGVGLLHGRMDSDAKRDVMQRFRDGEVQVLVATVVVEVGVDVPNATVMVIEHAERFGLSQLHQLRGRIVRGKRAGSCLLLAHEPSEEAKARLKVMTATDDGFRIAEEDYRLRGPGQFFGTRQHGVPELQMADLLRDKELLELARRDAGQLVSEDGLLRRPEHAALRARVERVFRGRLDLVDMG